MSVEFVDTNILIYAHDMSAGAKRSQSIELLKRLFDAGSGAMSVQVLCEFYAAATGKLRMKPEKAEEILQDLEGWLLHRLSHADLLAASRLHCNHKLSWWDALILQSAMEMGCSVLWSEDFSHGQKYGALVIRNPFKEG